MTINDDEFRVIKSKVDAYSMAMRIKDKTDFYQILKKLDSGLEEGGDLLFSRKAAWVLEIYSHKCSDGINAYYSYISRVFIICSNMTVARHLAKMITMIDGSSVYTSELINRCFTLANDNNVPVAVKVHCMQILANCCAYHPDLSAELRLLIESNIEKNSSAFKARAKLLLKSINN